MTPDWAMVIITAIYVVATIVICWANIKSANASKLQLDEMQRQFLELNRPEIEVEFHYLRKAWYVLRFVNHGEKTAQHLKINVDQDFIDSLQEKPFQKGLENLKGKECIIGVGEHYDLYLGSNNFRGNPNMKPFIATVEYEFKGNEYKSEIHIDLEDYMTFFSSTTEEEDVLKYLKNTSQELKDIQKSITYIGKCLKDSTDSNM